MKRVLLIFILLLSIIFLSACIEVVPTESNNNDPIQQNSPPSRPNISVQNSTIESGQSTNISATANDPDGDPITYSWSATGGSFSSTTQASVVWTAPTVSSSQTYTITLNVSDNYGASNNNSVNIVVTTQSHSINLIATYDTYAFSGDTNSNYGGSNILHTGEINAGLFIAYIKFNLSSIPSNATITEAQLRLIEGGDSVSHNTIATTSVSQVLDHDWSEFGLNFSNKPSQLRNLINISIPFDGSSTEWLFDVKSAVVNWVNGFVPNYGFAINSYITSGNQNYCVFISKDYNNDGPKPKLLIKYTTP